MRMRNLLSFLAGSVSSITQAYWMQDPDEIGRIRRLPEVPGQGPRYADQ